MRIEWHDTEDLDNSGQFVVFAENELERALLRRFAAQTYDKNWEFRMHGSCYSCDLQGTTSFNFGFSKKPIVSPNANE